MIDCMMEIDFSQIQELLGSMTEKCPITFGELVALFRTGDFSGLKEQAVLWMKNQIGEQWLAVSDYSGILLLLVLYGLMCAMGHAFENPSIPIFAGVVVQLYLIARLTILYREFQEQIRGFLEQEIHFTNVLFPVLAAAAALSGRSVSASAFYLSAVSVSSLVSHICLYLLLPGAGVFLVFSLLDSLLEEPVFTGMIQLLKKGMGLLMKGTMTAVAGIQLLQLMVLPKADTLRRRTVFRTISLLPGAGNIGSAAMDVIWGSGSLLKGSIGAAGMCCILMTCILPILRLVLVSGIYQLLSALVFPIADKKMSLCLKRFAESLDYLVKISWTAGVICLLMVAAAAW